MDWEDFQQRTLVMAWNRHNNVSNFNWLMGSQSFTLQNWISGTAVHRAFICLLHNNRQICNPR
jgi:multisubunit Na+/H+ antiporter MnhE subunit